MAVSWLASRLKLKLASDIGTRDSGLGREANSAEEASRSREAWVAEPESRCPESRASALGDVLVEHGLDINDWRPVDRLEVFDAHAQSIDLHHLDPMEPD